MRLELTAPLELTGSSDPSERRIIAGLAVPWDTVARLSNGRRVRFAEGSVSLSDRWGRNPLLCVNHDRSNPVGVIDRIEKVPGGLYARARVSATQAGDDVLTLAADGVYRGLSVGVEATEWDDVPDPDDPDDPIMHVTAATWDELSVCPWQAFDGAAVDYVAASSPEPDPDPEPEEPPVTMTAADVPDVASPAPAVLQAASPPALIPARDRNPSLLAIARELSDAVRASGMNESPAKIVEPLLAAYHQRAERLTAALTDVTTPNGASGVAGLIRDSWDSEVLGLIEFGAPVVAAFMQGNLDSSPVAFPRWTTLPTVAVQATQKTQIGTGNVRIDKDTAAVATVAGGNDVAMQVVDWSTPDFIAEYFRAATEVYARFIDDLMLDTIVAGATDLEESGDGVGADLGAAIGMVAATGLPPDRIIAAGDIFGRLWGANVGIQSGGIASVLGVDLPRPRVVLAPLAPAGTFIVTSSRVAKSWQNRGAPVRLRALEVALLGVNLGVYGYFAHSIVHGPDTANPSIISVVPATP